MTIQLEKETKGVWIIEIVMAQLAERAVAKPVEFQVWMLTVNADRTLARLSSCEDGDEKTVFENAIPLTDFPADSITLCN